MAIGGLAHPFRPWSRPSRGASSTKTPMGTTLIDDAHPGDGGGAHSPPAAVVAVDILR
jgi:hypothetical protein